MLLRNKTGRDLVSIISRCQEVWQRSWQQSSKLSLSSQSTLIVSLANLPFSSDIGAPAIQDVVATVTAYVQNSKRAQRVAGEQDEVLGIVDSLFNLAVVSSSTTQ